MTVATANPVNDAALAAQLELTRDASIANLQQQSEEVQRQYKDEAAKIEDQKRNSAAVIQSTINAAHDNNAVQTEAEWKQAVKNADMAVHSWQHRGLSHLSQDTPEQIHANIVRTSQELMNAQEAYLAYHPEEKNNPQYQLHVAEDGEGNFSVQVGPQSELAEQTAIASLDDARSMPLDDLRKVVQRPNRQTPTDPLVRLVDNPDGTFDAVLQTGEIFKGFTGENRDAVRKLGESKVNTRRHYEALLAQQQPQPVNDQPPQAQPVNDPAVSANQSLTDWVFEDTARRFGYSNGAEMIADQKSRYQRDQQNNEVLNQYKNQQLVSQFFMEHPEYPNTPQADDAIEQIINRNGWEWTPDSMAAAHALAVQNRIYLPLTQDEIAVANGLAPQQQRPTAPPMLPGGNPDMARPMADPQTMPLDQLRKQILAGGR